MPALAKDNDIVVWNFESHTEAARLRGLVLPVTHIAVTPDGHRVAAASSWNGTFFLWEPKF